MIRFPRRGVEGAALLAIKRGGKHGKRVKPREMCNWIDCDVCFSDEAPLADSSEGSQSNADSGGKSTVINGGMTCGKCKLVKYCSAAHQRDDWSEHKRVCVRSI